MNKGLIAALSAIAGSAVGGFVAYRFLKDKYEQKANEEIAIVRESLMALLMEEQAKHMKKPASPETKPQEQQAKTEYRKVVSNAQYNTSSAQTQEPPVTRQAAARPTPVPKADDEPMIVDESDTIANGYPTIGITLWSDGIITDESHTVMTRDEVDKNLGKDAIAQLQDSDDWVIWIVNEKLRCNYEFAMDATKYIDFLKKHPDLLNKSS